MLDRWRDLDQGQRRVLATVGSLVVALALVAGVVSLTGSDGGHEALRTDQSSTSTSARTATTLADSSSTSSASASTASTAASGAGASATSTTAHGRTTATTKTPKGSGTTATTRAAGPTSTAGTTPTTTPTTAAPTSTTSAGACNPGGGNANANQIADLFCSYRANNGLAKMTRNSGLDQTAQRWAEKMAADAANGVPPGTALAHNLDPSTGYKAAVRSYCSGCNGWSENVAYDTSASGGWGDWLASRCHLADIAFPSGGEYGVGAAAGGGFIWVVQDFGYDSGSPPACTD